MNVPHPSARETEHPPVSGPAIFLPLDCVSGVSGASRIGGRT